MMSKEQFIKRMSLIQNFNSEQDTLSKLIDKLTDGFSIVNMGDYIISEIITMIEEDLGVNPNGDWLSWWLYDDVDKIVYYNGEEEISVKTLDELYDFLVNMSP